MRILILGGTRYFGLRLALKCLAEGHSLTIASSGKTPWLHDAEHLTIDRRNEISLQKAFEDHEWDLAYDQIGYNATDAKALATALQSKVGHVIFTSSQSVYDTGLMLSESDFTAETYEENSSNQNSYQEGKRLAEKEYTTQLNFSVTSVRFPIVLGPDDYTGRMQWHVSRIKNGLPIYFPNLNSRIGFISSQEASDFLYWLADKKMEGSCNAGSPDSFALRELVEIIEAATARKCILAPLMTTENRSPFGIESDWTMNTSKSAYAFSSLKSWLPSLILELAKRP